MRTFLIALVAVTLFTTASEAQTVQQSQAAAVRLFPSLAKKDSALNKRFLELYAAEKAVKPEIDLDPGWPMRLAKKAVEELKPVPIRATIVQHLAEGGLLLRGPSKPVESAVEYHGPAVSGSARFGGGGGVEFYPSSAPEPAYVTGTFILRGHPKEANLADEEVVKCQGISAGMDNGTAPNGKPRTLRAYTFTAAPPAPATPKPKTPLGSSLDRKKPDGSGDGLAPSGGLPP